MSLKPSTRTWLYAATAFALASVSGLVTNVASGDARWPGPLDYLRQYSWQSLIVITVLIVVLLALERRSQRDEDHPDPPDDPEPGARVVYQQSINVHGDVGSIGGVSGATGEAEAADEAENLTQDGEFVVLYSLCVFLGNGVWEEKIQTAIEEAAPNAIHAPFSEDNYSLPRVVVVVIAFSAAQSDKLKTKIWTKLRAVRSHMPTVRVVLVAAGLSDDPITEEEGLRWLKETGHSDRARFTICPTEDEFVADLSSKIRVALREKIMAERLRVLRQDADDS
ncbi:hypothetical protein [Actinomadura verrucosospora]